MLLPLQNSNKTTLTNGIMAYNQQPLEISQGGEVALVYTSTETLTVYFEYDVFDGNNKLIASLPKTSNLIHAGAHLFITYFAKPGTFTLGSNRLILTFYTSKDATIRTHYVSFYGYLQGVPLNLNNPSEVANAFYNEIEFIYNGYEEGTVVYRRTSFRTSVLPGNIYLATDYYFDFSQLYFYVTGNYPANFYTEAILYFKDPTLFPYLARVSGESALELKLTKEGNNIYFAPLRKLYVEPTTLHVRTEPINGYAPAERLYFPKEAYGKVNLTMCRLEIQNFGFHEFNLTYDFYLDVGMTYLGAGGLHEVIIIRN